MRRARVRSISVAVVALAATTYGLAGATTAVVEGDLDTGFGGSGVTSVPGTTGARAVAPLSNGRVVLAGGGSDFEVQVLKSDGTLDNNFDTDGKVVTAMSTNNDVATAVAVQSDGMIVVVGWAAKPSDANDHDLALARYDTSGGLDPTFDNDGEVFTDLSTGYDELYDVAIQSDGKIVAVGRTPGASGDDFLVVRYNSDGSLDTGFSGDGIKTTSFSTSHDIASAIALQGKKIVAGGVGNGDFALARYTAGGNLDSTFDSDGRQTTDFGGGAYDEVQDLALPPGGGIIAGGYSETAGSDVWALAKYTSAGAADTSFSGDGRLTTVVGSTGLLEGLAVQADGKLVGAGYGTGSDLDFAVVRYLPDGTLDNGFGTGGVVTTPMAGFDLAYDVLILRSAKILAAGAVSGYAGAIRYIGDATPPGTSHLVGLPKFVMTSTPKVSWSTATDDNSGVASYDLVYQYANRGTTTFSAPFTLTTTPKTSFTLDMTNPAGRTQCMWVTATDAAGNDGVAGPTGCTAWPVDERSMTASSGWTQKDLNGYYLGTAMRSTNAGSTLKLDVDYKRLALVVTKCPGCGAAKVFLDNALLKTVRTAAAQTTHRVVVPVDLTSSLTSGKVTIKQASDGKPVTIEGLGVSLA